MLSRREITPVLQLPLSNHVHDLDTSQGVSGGAKRFKAEHRFNNTLDCTMILLDDIIQILDLTERNVLGAFGIVSIDRCCIGPALVDRVFSGTP